MTKPYFKRVAPWIYMVQHSELGTVTIDARNPKDYERRPEPVELSDDQKRALEAGYKELKSKLFMRNGEGFHSHEYPNRCEWKKKYSPQDRTRFEELRALYKRFADYKAEEAHRRHEYERLVRQAKSWLSDHQDARDTRRQLAVRGLEHGDPVIYVADPYSHYKGSISAKRFYPTVRVQAPPLGLRRFQVIDVRDVCQLYKPGTEPPVRPVPSIEFEHLRNTLIPVWDSKTHSEQWYMLMYFRDPFTPTVRRVLKNGKLADTEETLYRFNFDRAMERIAQKEDQYQLAI